MRTTKRISVFSPDTEIAEMLQRHGGSSADPRKSGRAARIVAFPKKFSKKTRGEVVCVLPIREQQQGEIGAAPGNARLVLLCDADFPKEGIPDRLASLGVRDPARVHVHTTKNTDDAEEFVARLVTAFESEQSDPRIVDAYWLGDSFVVVGSPHLTKMLVAVHDIPALRDKDREALENFEIDEDGSFVYWPFFDIHLGWEQFAQIADPKHFLSAKQESADFNRRYGASIRKLREAARLSQTEIPELTARQVGRIERGECRATHKALTKLARAQGLPLPDYLSRLADHL